MVDSLRFTTMTTFIKHSITNFNFHLMGKIYFFRILMGMLILSYPVIAQKKVVVVQPDAGLNIGALNNAIKTDRKSVV